MNAITHHIPDNLLADYAAGCLSEPFALVVASHLSLCDECRAAFEARHAVGGALLETVAAEEISKGMKSQVLARLDDPKPKASMNRRSGVFPGPVMQALKGKGPKWKSIGLGVRQCVVSSNSSGVTRLLYIPSGSAVPDHGHNGLELTLVLQGSFSDETGQFGVGDLEVADDNLEHTPIADEGAPCICLAATDAPLRFSSLVPRLVQPFIRI